MSDRPVVLSSWRRIGRALFLGLLMAGQGRLTFHHHVSVPETPRAQALAHPGQAPQESEATCPICALAAHAAYAHLNAPTVLKTPSRVESVAVVPPVTAADSSFIRLSARAPPAC